MINQEPLETNSMINQEPNKTSSRIKQEPSGTSSRINLEPIAPKSILRRRRYRGVDYMRLGPGNRSDYSRSDISLDISNGSETTHPEKENGPDTGSLNPNSMNSKLLY